MPLKAGRQLAQVDLQQLETPATSSEPGPGQMATQNAPVHCVGQVHETRRIPAVLNLQRCEGNATEQLSSVTCHRPASRLEVTDTYAYTSFISIPGYQRKNLTLQHSSVEKILTESQEDSYYLSNLSTRTYIHVYVRKAQFLCPLVWAKH